MTGSGWTGAKTVGKPAAGSEYVNQLALHLQRYVGPYVAASSLERVWVNVGFVHTEAESTTFRVSAREAERCTPGWSMDDLIAQTSGGPDRPALTAPEPGARRLALLPLRDGASTTPGLADGPLGFVMLDAERVEALTARDLSELAGRCAEAIRAARRNSVRLTLEGTVDQGGVPIKEVIYEVMDHLPEWLGVDHSAALLLTRTMSSVVVLGDAPTVPPVYEVMAERLFFGTSETERLVGLSVPTGDGPDEDGVFAHAVRLQGREPERRYHRYLPEDAEGRRWRGVDGEGTASALGVTVARPAASRRILVPLVTHQLDGDGTELIGWLDMSWRHGAQLPASTGPMLGLIADALAARLRASAVYTLSARQVQLLAEVGQDVVAALAHEDLPGRIDAFVGRIVDRMARMTDLPSFSIGRVQPGPRPILRFVHAHGWTGFDALELPILAEDVSEAGVVGLAVRLGAPVALVGGSEAETAKAWNNTVWVHEERGLLSDSRRRLVADLEAEGWRRLSDYYRSAHAGTYATLAFPIAFGGEIQGVIAVEVERTTTWLWWSGLGSQLFYHLLGAELAMGFKLLEAL